MALEEVMFIFHSSFFILHFSSRSPDDQAGLYHSTLYGSGGCAPFAVVEKYIYGFYAYAVSPLLYGRQHWVAGYGALTIGETADAEVVWHVKT